VGQLTLGHIRVLTNTGSSVDHLSIDIFTITAEIHAGSLAKFYGQQADRHMNLKFMGHISERMRDSTI